MSEFNYSPMFPLSEDKTEYIKISDSFIKTSIINDSEILTIDPKALTLLSQRAFKDVSHLLRKSHLQQLRDILDDEEASNNVESENDPASSTAKCMPDVVRVLFVASVASS